MNNIPQNLLDKQELQRQQTINLVLRAIEELKSEGHIIRIKELMDHTGLSRSTFSKTHIREVLVRYGIVSVPSGSAIQATQNNKSAVQKLKSKIKKQDEIIGRLREDNSNLKTECELLRGKIFLLLQQQQTD